ncbi:pilus assembly protein, partial [Candidatus Uhrbacteria bacterium]|nr:pilus assembly protein [Candidatus Uhrbacteria bacterium]
LTKHFLPRRTYCKGPRRALPRRCGAALVEMALVVLVLVVILLGIIDIGYVFFVQHNMVNAARDAARAVAVRDGTTSAAIAVAQNRLEDIPLDFNIDVSVPDGSNPTDRDVSVLITTPLNAASFGLLTGTLRADVTMRLEGEAE